MADDVLVATAEQDRCGHEIPTESFSTGPPGYVPFCKITPYCRTSRRGKTTPAAKRPQPFRQDLLDPPAGCVGTRVVPILLPHTTLGIHLRGNTGVYLIAKVPHRGRLAQL